MAAQATARASPELRKAPLSPRYRRNYTTTRGTTQRKPHFLYVDEFHLFTTTAFAGMLSELRKYHLGLVLSHQYKSQLDQGVFDAILGNTGTIITFRLGASDASILANQLASDVPTASDW